jgi:hypothetical protein
MRPAEDGKKVIRLHSCPHKKKNGIFFFKKINYAIRLRSSIKSLQCKSSLTYFNDERNVEADVAGTFAEAPCLNSEIGVGTSR